MPEQEKWVEQAAFMNALAEDGFVVLGGPLGDGARIGEQRAPAASAARARPDLDGGRRQRAGAPIPGAAGGQAG
jgi:hypothetical protein